MERYKHDMKVAANKRYIIFGMTGCLCFGIGDWLLGYVEPTLTGGDVFYFIRAGHGADYDMAKSVVTLILMIIGICFLYPGLLHISEIANGEKTKRPLKYAYYLRRISADSSRTVSACGGYLAEKNISEKIGVVFYSCCSCSGYYTRIDAHSAFAVFLWALYVLHERRYACVVWVSSCC